ncbi:MAG TPA: DUF883 domain-containing protein [Thermodesulfobacteriota bacterium]|jgi:ElaB/YqjD/DUF883 family membrane-anchored ribosome-binding protein|nr:DUF883 domain-containing protein [Thermodesulfobacteriota bacterium]
MREELDLREDLNMLRQDVSKLGSDLTELAHKLLDVGRSETIDAKEKFLEQGRKTREAVEKKIEERPIIVILAAFILGFVLGKLLERK